MVPGSVLRGAMDCDGMTFLSILGWLISAIIWILTVPVQLKVQLDQYHPPGGTISGDLMELSEGHEKG